MRKFNWVAVILVVLLMGSVVASCAGPEAPAPPAEEVVLTIGGVAPVTGAAGLAAFVPMFTSGYKDPVN